MSFRLAPEDARRGGLVILGASVEEAPHLARVYADGGYETIVAEAGDQADPLVQALKTPVFLLALPDAAAVGWDVSGVAAVSIIADVRVSPMVAQAPTSPTILHLGPAAHAALAGAFEAAQPDLPVHLHLATTDGERLLHLRTLRWFSTHAGGRGEV